MFIYVINRKLINLKLTSSPLFIHITFLYFFSDVSLSYVRVYFLYTVFDSFKWLSSISLIHSPYSWQPSPSSNSYKSDIKDLSIITTGRGWGVIIWNKRSCKIFWKSWGGPQHFGRFTRKSRKAFCVILLQISVSILWHDCTIEVGFTNGPNIRGWVVKLYEHGTFRPAPLTIIVDNSVS